MPTVVWNPRGGHGGGDKTRKRGPRPTVLNRCQLRGMYINIRQKIKGKVVEKLRNGDAFVDIGFGFTKNERAVIKGKNAKGLGVNDEVEVEVTQIRKFPGRKDSWGRPVRGSEGNPTVVVELKLLSGGRAEKPVASPPAPGTELAPREVVHVGKSEGMTMIGNLWGGIRRDDKGHPYFLPENYQAGVGAYSTSATLFSTSFTVQGPMGMRIVVGRNYPNLENWERDYDSGYIKLPGIAESNTGVDVRQVKISLFASDGIVVEEVNTGKEFALMKGFYNERFLADVDEGRYGKGDVFPVVLTQDKLGKTKYRFCVQQEYLGLYEYKRAELIASKEIREGSAAAPGPDYYRVEVSSIGEEESLVVNLSGREATLPANLVLAGEKLEINRCIDVVSLKGQGFDKGLVCTKAFYEAADRLREAIEGGMRFRKNPDGEVRNIGRLEFEAVPVAKGLDDLGFKIIVEVESHKIDRPRLEEYTFELKAMTSWPKPRTIDYVRALNDNNLLVVKDLQREKVSADPAAPAQRKLAANEFVVTSKKGAMFAPELEVSLDLVQVEGGKEFVVHPSFFQGVEVGGIVVATGCRILDPEYCVAPRDLQRWKESSFELEIKGFIDRVGRPSVREDVS